MKISLNFPPDSKLRQGAFLILALFCLILCLMFVSFSVDVGYMNLTKIEMQACADAAALAAAQEISAAVQDAPQGTSDIVAYARTAAIAEAVSVAEMNGYYVSASSDVKFGRRSYNPETEEHEIDWTDPTANVVKVSVRKDNDDPTAEDAKLKLFFAGVMNSQYATITADAIAVVDARDIVVVHDFSRSMNFDSHYSDEAVTRLSRDQLYTNMLACWDDLGRTLGSLPREPAYLTLSNTKNGVHTTVNFAYDDAAVTTDGPLKSAKVWYENGGSKSFNNLSGSTATLDGNSNLSKVEVVTEETVEVEPTDDTVSNYSVNVTFSANRKSFSASGSRRIKKYKIRYEDGSETGWYNQSYNYPYSVSRNTSKRIERVKLNVKKNSNSYTTKSYYAPSQEPQIVTTTQTFEDNNSNVKSAFGLNSVSWPWNGGSWDGYFNHCRTYSRLEDTDDVGTDTDLREKFGGVTLINYLIRYQSNFNECNELWKTRHYPFHAIKEGHELFCDFLYGLGFDDQIGMVSYDSNHRVETTLAADHPDFPIVNISADPITNDYTSVNNLMKYKQASHYSNSTNMGGGLEDGIWLLDNHQRAGVDSTILLMTDGNTNTMDDGDDGYLPAGWDWDVECDYDGDGYSDYSTSSGNKKYVLRLAYEAREKGYTVHTMSVGADADRALMKAIAHVGHGHWINVPGGTSVTEMEDELKAAFHKIASFVPPARLLPDPDES